jgi:hypothetical protein
MFGEREEEVTDALLPQSYKNKSRERESVCVCVCARARAQSRGERNRNHRVILCVVSLIVFFSFTMPQISIATRPTKEHSMPSYHGCKSKIAP